MTCIIFFRFESKIVEFKLFLYNLRDQIFNVGTLLMSGCNKKNPVDPVVPLIPELNSPSDEALLISNNPIEFSWSIITS